MDASEFAVHLDQVRDGRAPKDYQEPQRFFERTYLTRNLTDLATQVLRRLSGVTVETSAVFNMATQFGGGKTHALALLYHLANNGPRAETWQGIRELLRQARVGSVPDAATAVFVGTEFDSIKGRGGEDGTPLRRTPWGEIAWQLGGKESFAAVATHDEKGIAPAVDVIRAFLPDRPALILVDELVNYMSRNRKSGLTSQLYDFLQNLSETVRGRENVVLAVSIPSLMDEMTPDDYTDFDRFKKMLDRVGKAILLSAETEAAEIIRRRLFEWGGIPDDAKKTATAYAEWVLEHHQLVGDFAADSAREQFLASYPFHPALLSVFERKWQSLPRFQKTRGILRLLALWVSRAYQDDHRGARKDPLIGLGTAPLDDPYFRAALFEQLGTDTLEGAVTTDIAGKKEAHAARLDREAVDDVKKARLHQKVATVIFFESNGGQTKTEATLPEIRLAVAEPDLNIANVETALEALTERCYFLGADRNRYRFSLSPNLNKLLADRRSSIREPRIIERLRQEVQTVFKGGTGLPEPKYFPEKTSDLPNRPVLVLVVCKPEQTLADPETRKWIERMIRESGSSDRTFKSALLFAVPDNAMALQEEARKLLAWEDISDDEDTVKRLDETYRRQLNTNLEKAVRDLKESVWRTYRFVIFLGMDNTLREVDLGLVHSSAAESMMRLIVNRLRQDGEIEYEIGPNLLVKKWPPAFTEWSTKAVRDAFFASPQFPRLLNGEILKDTIARGVGERRLAYVGKTASGDYEPFSYGDPVNTQEVELSDDMFLITKETAERYKKAKERPPTLTSLVITPQQAQVQPGKRQAFLARGLDQDGATIGTPDLVWAATGGAIDRDGVFLAGENEGTFTVTVTAGSVNSSAPVIIARELASPVTVPTAQPQAAKGLRWIGTIPPQKWMNFYTKVLSRFSASKGLKLTLTVEVIPDSGTSEQKIEETKIALRELGLNDDVETRE